MRTRIVILAAAAAMSLGACASDGAYAGGNVGLGFNDGYYNPAACWNYGFSNYAYLGPYCGWYNGYFYPGSGDYVYDRHHHAYSWTGGQQNYWTTQARSPDGGRTVGLGSSGGAAVPGVVGASPSGFGPGPAKIANSAPAGFGPGPAKIGNRSRGGFGFGGGGGFHGGIGTHGGGGRRG